MAGGDELANAAARGKTADVERLLHTGADPNALNSYGRTPIQVMMMGNTRIAELLLLSGADPNRRDPTGLTAVHDAAREGFLDTVRILCQYGGQMNILDDQNHLPIDLAKENGHQEVVDFLQTFANDVQ
ncbi:cyclin-dependent kinase 4 inhibitor B [Latimeria chalumnae]|uniref:Cyclin dependent kinase inhibitor 2A n=1 Tax=Latimeria chalumnae TaxID=7897 RepID=H2ZVG1_LATCH|nr:PREDICTED: cyclin-dependent kinase 4 inhibitor B [Latimeria chalumnae]|eukprot:XP_006012260.1 PREDICTED: cyclin-dependent kinase 4 inhibitor B [Latimeria chalumnae]